MNQGGSDEGVNLEEAFFAKENARLLRDLQRKEERDERREALRAIVNIHDNAFLDRLITLGIGPEQAMALRLIPLIFVAWADGTIDEREREAILRAAHQEGITADEGTRKMLDSWLAKRPDPSILRTWKSYIRHIWARFTTEEQNRMRTNLMTSTREVANAAGGILGLAKISAAEQAVLDELEKVVE